jgi:4a-hydroxytetrahydrobiopterin dehydratase
MAYDRSPLSPEALQEFLSKHPQWRHEALGLRRDYEFATFKEAMEFVKKVAKVAEKHDHHPDIDIRYTKVTLRLTSHDAGGLTFRDPMMADLCEGLR